MNVGNFCVCVPCTYKKWNLDGNILNESFTRKKFIREKM